MKANPIYCSIDEQASEHAGMQKIYLLCGVLPYYNGILVFSPWEKYTIRHRNSAINMVMDWI